MKRAGHLFYDMTKSRYDIAYKEGGFYGGLHCGDCFTVYDGEAWVETRIELGEDWYLVGLPKLRPLSGLLVQI